MAPLICHRKPHRNDSLKPSKQDIHTVTTCCAHRSSFQDPLWITDLCTEQDLCSHRKGGALHMLSMTCLACCSERCSAMTMGAQTCPQSQKSPSAAAAGPACGKHTLQQSAHHQRWMGAPHARSPQPATHEERDLHSWLAFSGFGLASGCP